MPKKSCRYNKSHKFDTDDEVLSHEKYCPDKSKRKDLKVCPYNSKHVILTKQYEKHVKNCKYKPKDQPKTEETKTDEGNPLDKADSDNLFDNWDLKVEKWFNESMENIDEIRKEKNKIITQKLKSNSNQDLFDEEDFIFKQCYI